MTLGSALPWRACSMSSPLSRIQPRRRLGLAALGSPRTVHRGALVRAQSTGTDATTEATKPAKPSAEDARANASLSSLIDRLSRIPVRPHDANGPVVVKPVTPYPHERENHEALQKHHRALTQQLRLESYRQHDRGGDWRAILQNLVRWTPTQAAPRDLKVIIPRRSAGRLLSTGHERNLWEIRSRTGCDMTLYRPTGEGANIDPYVILSGQPAAMSAALDDILKATKGVTVVNMQGHAEKGLQGDQAGLDAAAVKRTIIRPHQMSVPCRPYALKIRADRIPRPSAWTVEAFQQYTAALVMGHMDADLARRLYPRGATHKDTVVQQLHAVFNDPAASAAVSLPALKLVLRYFAEAGETHINDSRALIDRAEALGLRIDTGIYNLVAETAVYAKNMHALECTLSQMTVHGHAPNVWTWLLLLRMVEAEEVRRYILQAMDTKNFFSDPATVNRVSGIMADQDAYRAIQQGQDWDAFMAGLRELYGPGWRLHPRAANRYLDVFGSYGKFDQMRRLLEYMFESTHGRPNAVSLNTVITHCKTQRKVDLAVSFVRMFDERGYNVVNQITLDLLFGLARKTRKPHLLSAVWRYAHRLEMTNYGMRAHGISLLAGRHGLSQLTDRIRGLWEEPHNCKIGKREFIEDLLLCDYKTGRVASSIRPLATRGRTNKKPRKPPDAASGPPSDADTSAASEKASPKSEAGQRNATVSNEEAGTTAETRAAKDKEPHHNPPRQMPRAPSGEEPAAQRNQAPAMSAAEMYDLYAKAISKKAEKFVPATPLGEFLQAALDCDRGLHKLVHEEGETQQQVYKGVPVDMHPVKLPVVKRGAAGNAMLKWLADKKAEERAAGVAQDSEDQFQGVIDVMGGGGDDGEYRERLGAVGSRRGRGTDEATAAKGGAIDQPPTEVGGKENDVWDEMLLEWHESESKKQKKQASA